MNNGKRARPDNRRCHETRKPVRGVRRLEARGVADYSGESEAFVSGVIVSRGDERFIFNDLGNRVYRAQAYERGIEWAKRWIDNNYRLAARKAPQG
jgi:hypothetical protein